MIQKMNLKDQVNAATNLFSYHRVDTLNNHMLNVLQAENRTLDFHVGQVDIALKEGYIAAMSIH